MTRRASRPIHRPYNPLAHSDLEGKNCRRPASKITDRPWLWRCCFPISQRPGTACNSLHPPPPRKQLQGLFPPPSRSSPARSAPARGRAPGKGSEKNRTFKKKKAPLRQGNGCIPSHTNLGVSPTGYNGTYSRVGMHRSGLERSFWKADSLPRSPHTEQARASHLSTQSRKKRSSSVCSRAGFCLQSFTKARSSFTFRRSMAGPVVPPPPPPPPPACRCCCCYQGGYWRLPASSARARPRCRARPTPAPPPATFPLR